MPEEIIREVAATGEFSGDGGPPRNLASPEFFFLLQRIDRLDEKLTGEIKFLDNKITALDNKLTGEIKALDNKFTSEIKALDNKFTSEIKALSGEINIFRDRQNERIDSLKFWMISALVAIVAGFAGTIATLAIR